MPHWLEEMTRCVTGSREPRLDLSPGGTWLKIVSESAQVSGGGVALVSSHPWRGGGGGDAGEGGRVGGRGGGVTSSWHQTNKQSFVENEDAILMLHERVHVMEASVACSTSSVRRVFKVQSRMDPDWQIKSYQIFLQERWFYSPPVDSSSCLASRKQTVSLTSFKIQFLFILQLLVTFFLTFYNHYVVSYIQIKHV